MSLLPVLLAASAQNRCTSLVCSCYVPSRCSDYKGEQDNNHRSSSSNNNRNKKRLQEANKDGVMEEVCNDHSNGGGGGSNCTNGPHTDPTPLKSNLKKTTTPTVEVITQPPRMIGTRKVNWPDAHGKDIAHVQEFDPSLSEDGELGGVQNSCVCAIQ